MSLRYLVAIGRHGESVYNAACSQARLACQKVSICNSQHLDSELTPAGIRACKPPVILSRPLEPRHGFCSPLKRAVDTFAHTFGRGTTTQKKTELNCMLSTELTEKVWGACDIACGVRSRISERRAAGVKFAAGPELLALEDPDQYILRYIDCPDLDKAAVALRVREETRRTGKSFGEVMCDIIRERELAKEVKKPGVVGELETDESVARRGEEFGMRLLEMAWAGKFEGDVAVISSKRFIRGFISCWTELKEACGVKDNWFSCPNGEFIWFTLADLEEAYIKRMKGMKR